MRWKGSRPGCSGATECSAAGATEVFSLCLLLFSLETLTGRLAWSYDLALSLRNAREIEDAGGWWQGGVFGEDGWTTTDGRDHIVIPLPPGVNAWRGWYGFRLSHLEGNPQPGRCDQLDISTFSYSPTSTRDDENRVYLNICYTEPTSECDSEGITRAGRLEGDVSLRGGWATWLTGPHVVNPSESYEFRQEWVVQGETRDFYFKLDGSEFARVSADSGSFDEPQFYVVLNACGPPDSYCAAVHGDRGIIGATFSDLRIHLSCGDGTCEAGEDCRLCPEDCGSCSGADAGDADAGDADAGDADAGDGDAGDGDAADGDAADEVAFDAAPYPDAPRPLDGGFRGDGGEGCGCVVAGGGSRGLGGLLGLVAGWMLGRAGLVRLAERLRRFQIRR